MKLPNDIARCAGRDMAGISIGIDYICPQRDTCARYIALSKTDKDSGVADYKYPYISVTSLMCYDGNFDAKIQLRGIDL